MYQINLSADHDLVVVTSQGNVRIAPALSVIAADGSLCGRETLEVAGDGAGLVTGCREDSGEAAAGGDDTACVAEAGSLRHVALWALGCAHCGYVRRASRERRVVAALAGVAAGLEVCYTIVTRADQYSHLSN